jgi:L-alanine-DL-glutamate epimerase-like enolase superfamily enzyme
MKIAKLETFTADGGWDVWGFLKLTTDSGLAGWSEFAATRGRKGLGTLVASLGEMLIGQEPRDLGAIETRLQGATRSVSGGLAAHAVGALVNACLDLKAKALGIPVHELLGGAVRSRVPVYWSRCGVSRALQARLFDGTVIDRPAVRSLADLAVAGREARERGFAALKTNLLVFDETGGRRPRGERGPELNVDEALIQALVAQLDALRQGAGPQMRLIVDLNFDYKTEGFRRFAKKLEPFELMWLEMDTFDPRALAFIRQSTTTPIGSLEAVLGRRALKPFLEQGAVDVAIVDVMYNGMLESLRMASLADAYEVNVAGHGFAGPLATVISGHFSSVIPNLRILECDVDEVPWRPLLLTNPYRLENGALILPDGPGWGTEIDEGVLRAHRAEP